MAALFKTQGMTKKFGQFTAVNKVDIVMEADRVNGVIGPNGSGKTTLFNLLTGFFPPTYGSIDFMGQNITNTSPQHRVSLGISRTFQLVSVFSTLSVWENMVLSTAKVHHQDQKVPWFYFKYAGDSQIRQQCMESLEKVGLSDKVNEKTAELSYGDKRLLEIGIALSMNPKALLLDEPFAGLSDIEIEFVLQLLHELKQHLPIVIIEHKISKIIELVEHLYVMKEGSMIMEGDPRKVIDDPVVLECYWGKGDVRC
ncbi:ABC transporter ATP-binding protein [Anoxynatronum buryatiense]|uniref:Amino acid/amide ABC transporter ATP-binding protein 1, HAAT family n=1 Tax=Anoxynatronum buryatiense TaxID=489973 RepID=A0AA45WVJ3_9CLOT|nr:ABC transporter ATP-binding protein [Anoxynatronum buryatiense]SMP53838.1 amino acid/amide ABC transporter ATP-binding protein 1, HAAT family [Anoxynatronum buryatiense]